MVKKVEFTSKERQREKQKGKTKRRERRVGTREEVGEEVKRT